MERFNASQKEKTMNDTRTIAEGDLVSVGLFEGRVVRVIEWHMRTTYDVEIDGVIDRYPAESVTLIEKGERKI